MTIRRLRTLVAVAQTRTFSAAAEAVFVTHAAVSQQMKALEAELGVTLFDRNTKPPQLTQTGQKIVAKARLLIADYDNLVPSGPDKEDLYGTVTLGVLRTTLTGLTPAAMALLKARFPDLGLLIRPGLTTTLLADIKRGHLDVALTSRPQQMPEGLSFRPLAQEPLHVITALEEVENDPVRVLKKRPFIRFDRTAVVGALIENWILAQRIHVNETMELDSLEAITGMVRANLGVSIVPKLVVQAHDSQSVRQIDLGPNAPQRTLGLVYRKDQADVHRVDALFEAFIAAIHAASSQTVPR